MNRKWNTVQVVQKKEKDAVCNHSYKQSSAKCEKTKLKTFFFFLIVYGHLIL